MTNSDLLFLHEALTARYRPEDVASACGRILAARLTDSERQILGRASRHAERRSLMSDDWERPTMPRKQVELVATLFGSVAQPLPDVTDPSAIRAWAQRLGSRVAWTEGQYRVPSRAEMDTGIGSRRSSVRAWRALGRLSGRVDQYDWTLARYRFATSGRSGFASEIALSEVEADADAACFAAYFSARVNVRRRFTLSGKDNPMDEVATMLFDRLTEESDWWLVARVTPTVDAIGHLSDGHRGELIGRYTNLMRETALTLARLDSAVPADRKGWVVRRGQDSDTWNLAAQAYNRARDSWLNVLEATNLTDDVLAGFCPPKAMRLMAADLVYWHRGELDPNTAIAAALPFVGDVFARDVRCTRGLVIAVCRDLGLDPYTSGWAGRRAARAASDFVPTPELVHGVTVSDPIVAAVLRRAGVWSAKERNGDPGLWELAQEYRVYDDKGLANGQPRGIV